MHAKIVYLYACTYLLGAHFLCLYLLVFTKFNIVLLHCTWNYFVDTQILYCVCLKSKTLRNCLSSPAFLHHFYRNKGEFERWIRSKKIFYRPLDSWYNSVICCYKRNFYLVYSFSEQFATKGNSSETAW